VDLFCAVVSGVFENNACVVEILRGAEVSLY
jgi:hypothetical protein